MEHTYENCHNLTCRRKERNFGYNQALEDFEEWLNKNNITFHQWKPEHNCSVWVSFKRVFDDFKNQTKEIEECVEILKESYPITDNEDILYGFSCAIQRMEQLKEQRNEGKIAIVSGGRHSLSKAIQLSKAYQQGRADEFEELKSLLRCRNYRGCAAGKGCDGVCSIDSDICRSCENFGIPYSLLEQKGAENDRK